MQIRLMEEEKISAYLEFWRRIPGMGLNDYDDSEEGLRRFLRRNPKTAFAVWEGDALLGTILAGHDGRRGRHRDRTDRHCGAGGLVSVQHENHPARKA